MNFFLDGLQQAWDLIWSGNPELVQLLEVTLQVVAVSTGVSLVLGLPVGLALALGRFPGRGVLVVVANTGFALPPVVVGLVLALLMFPQAPLGGLDLLFTLRGVFIAQTCLALPLMVALTVSAVRDTPPGLLDQARAFGAGRLDLALLAAREARTGILAATIAAVGSGLSEVGAIVLVGGNIRGYDQTLASAALESIGAGRYAEGMAIGIILLGLIVVLTSALTWLQYGRRSRRTAWSAS
ncbi:ABC transporter permease subunit [Nocardioides anomalus]|uniref:ABC transporter permease subunit n=1 Tax=Nocardioides anomalus TaxID=2712223 RepID=A0A6G6W9E5_9ACTN|nr:ABC transporter permease [Nocardioides anomalus]QIG41842.1 ABC transporter permease subunit [Nocardioides anomalus]